MKILLCPFCYEPASAACDDPQGVTGRFEFACRACGVFQMPGQSHRSCEVCRGEGMLIYRVA